MRPPRHLALLLAVMLLSGHAAGLQLVAWSGMLLTRVQSMPVAQAVVSTFDGSDPCRICRVVDVLQGDHAPAAPKVDHPAPHLALAEAVVQPEADRVPAVIPAIGVLSPPLSRCADVPTPPPRCS